MSIPQAFIDDLKARTSISRVIGQFVNWDGRKSRPANGDYWACCPFHREKTPSFHVTESRGTYYCFGCHASGNAFTFLEQHRRMDFRESVEHLANLAGMAVPEETPADRQQASAREALLRLLERANGYFQRCLHESVGRRAHDYILGRGFKQETLAQFGIGYAPDTRHLLEMCRSDGITSRQLIAAGLARESGSGNGLYPVFRDRLMIPITDLKGRIIAFGGRAMKDGEPAKYLNSPATELFNKGTVLFNHQTARSVPLRTEPLIVTEGYLDVMALSEAGIARSVAPLGTAITDSHLLQLWQMHQTPILCLDGDEAGQRAADRTMHLALPLLKPGFSLQFCILPDGLDPDDVLRQSGTDAFRHLLSNGVSFADFLWGRYVRGRDLASPDHQAKLQQELKQTISRIENSDVRKSYLAHIKDRVWNDILRKSTKSAQVQDQTDIAKGRAEVMITDGYLQESPRYFDSALALVLCIHHPELIDVNMARLEGLELPAVHAHQQILSTLMEIHSESGLENVDLVAALNERVGRVEIDRLLGLKQLSIQPELTGSGRGEEAKHLLEDVLFRLESWNRAEDLVAAIDSMDAEVSCEHSAEQLFHHKAGLQQRLAANPEAAERVTLGQVTVSKNDLEQIELEMNIPSPGRRSRQRQPDGEISTRQSIPDADLDALQKELNKA